MTNVFQNILPGPLAVQSQGNSVVAAPSCSTAPEVLQTTITICSAFPVQITCSRRIFYVDDLCNAYVCSSEEEEWVPLEQGCCPTPADRIWVSDPTGSPQLFSRPDGPDGPYYRYNPETNTWQKFSGDVPNQLFGLYTNVNGDFVVYIMPTVASDVEVVVAVVLPCHSQVA